MLYYATIKWNFITKKKPLCHVVEIMLQFAGHQCPPMFCNTVHKV